MSELRRVLHMKVSQGQEAIRDHSFNSFPIVFGRGRDCHMSLGEFDFVSRIHGAITVENDAIVVSDLESRNGILHGGERVPLVRLGRSGRFQVGSLEFYIYLIDAQVEPSGGTATQREIKTSPVIRIPIPEKVDRRRKPRFMDVPETPAQQTPSVKPQLPLPEAPKVAPTISPPEPELFKEEVGGARTGISLELDQAALTMASDDVSLQGVVTWGGDVFDVRQFYSGDTIRLGPHPSEPIFLPTTTHESDYGQYESGKGLLRFPISVKWRVTNGNWLIAQEDLVTSGQSKIVNNHVEMELKRDQIFSVNLGDDLELHLRYVEVPRPFVPRHFIDNKEEFKKAIGTSTFLHILVFLYLFFLAPVSNAPRVENVPPRFAKLLVEPPKTPFKPPVKEEPPPPKPEPPKVVEKPKPAPKPIAKAKPKKSPPKQPPREQAQTTQPVNKTPPKSAEEQMADSFASAFDAPVKTEGLKVDKIQVAKQSNTTTSVSPTELMKTLSSKGGRLPASSGTGSMAAKIGQVGFAIGGISGKAGKREVAGTVVGRPSFAPAAGIQGLDQKQIMKIVNQHVAAIQQCYERSLLDNPNLSGRIEFEWDISAQGSVGSSRVKRSDVAGGETLVRCVLGIIQGMKFPAAQNGHSTLATIGFPFGRN